MKRERGIDVALTVVFVLLGAAIACAVVIGIFRVLLTGD
jgi:hypothetical protein